jgi:hypothetical protein
MCVGPILAVVGNVPDDLPAEEQATIFEREGDVLCQVSRAPEYGHLLSRYGSPHDKVVLRRENVSCAVYPKGDAPAQVARVARLLSALRA